MKKKLYPCFLFFLFAVSLSQAQPAGYQYVREIIIRENQVPDGTNLNNFPYLFKATLSDLRSTVNGGHVSNSNGYDILFYQNSCSTPLDHQLDYYDPVTGEVSVWVRLPVLSTTSDTRVYMYYGNTSVSASTSVNATWDAGYSGIWHLGNDPTASAPQVTDATGNAHNGTTYGSMNATNVVSGKIGRAFRFDEVNDYVRIPDFLYGQELTVSFWFNAAEVTGTSYQYLFSHGTWATQNSLNVYAGEDNISIPSETHNNSMIKSVFRDNNDANNFDTLDAGNTLIDGNWHYYTLRIQNFGGAYVYIDGVPVVIYSVWGANTFNPATDIFLAAREDLNAGRFYGGLLDEVRISSVWRTSNWIRTEFNNQNDPASFSTIGIEAPSLGYCTPLAMNVLDFSAKRVGSIVKLNWNLPTNRAGTAISIERSSNGNDWTLIGNARESFADSTAPAGILFYRLKYSEGKSLYISAVKKLNTFDTGDSIRIFPNPSPGHFYYIELPGTEPADHFSLVDISGIAVQQINVEKKNSRLYMLQLNPATKKGIYYLRFRYNNKYQSKMILYK